MKGVLFLKLIIAEKPDAAKKMAEPYGGKLNKEKGYIEVPPCSTFPQGAIFCFAIGHLVGLASPESYNEEWKKWSLQTLPLIPEHFKYQVSKGKEKAFQVIRKLLQDSRIQEIVIATDAGREGEAIAWYIMKMSGVKNINDSRVPIKRLWISSLTEAGVKKGFSSLRNASETYSYYEEANARGIADWTVGMSMTRAATILLQNHDQILKDSGPFSVGRVQTALLSLLKKREDEILNFKSEPFWNVFATFDVNGKQYEGKWFNEQSDRFMGQQEALKVVSSCKGKTSTIKEVKKERKATKAPMLFNLSALQTKANKVYKMSPQKVLEIAQSLYTKGFLSYPRSDSQYLTENEARELPAILQKLRNKAEYQNLIPTPKSSIEQDKRYTNASKVSDHHAIIVTEQIPSNLADDEQKIYDLVARSVIAAFYEDAIFDHTHIVTQVESFSFVTRGKQLIQEGWRKILFPNGEKSEEGENQEEDTILPPLSEHEVGVIKDIKTKEGKTQPPKRYSQGDLITLMKTAGKAAEISEEDWDEDGLSLKEAEKLGSIGTEATRAGIIQTILDRQYIKISKNKVFVTDKGNILIESLIKSQCELVSPIMTAKWEHKLGQIGEKKYPAFRFTEEIKALTTGMVKQIIQSAPLWNFRTQIEHMQKEELIGLCPKCQSPIKEFQTKDKKRFFACTGYKDGCKFAFNKSFLNKSLTPNQVKKLLDKGKTDVIKGFKTSGGKTFDTFLWLTDEYKIDFGFNHPEEKKKREENKPKQIGICPKCSKALMEHPTFIGCSGYKDGCKYGIPKVFLKKKLPISAIKSLLKGEPTEIIEGFEGKSGKPFNAKLNYNLNEMRIDFIFDNQKVEK